MIYLEKNGAKVSTNDEGVATAFEEDGYTRVRGWRYLVLVCGKAAKKSLLSFVIPALVALVLFHVCDGRDHAVFVLGTYTFYMVQSLFKQV